MLLLTGTRSWEHASCRQQNWLGWTLHGSAPSFATGILCTFMAAYYFVNCLLAMQACRVRKLDPMPLVQHERRERAASGRCSCVAKCLDGTLRPAFTTSVFYSQRLRQRVNTYGDLFLYKVAVVEVTQIALQTARVYNYSSMGIPMWLNLGIALCSCSSACISAVLISLPDTHLWWRNAGVNLTNAVMDSIVGLVFTSLLLVTSASSWQYPTYESMWLHVNGTEFSPKALRHARAEAALNRATVTTAYYSIRNVFEDLIPIDWLRHG